MFVTNISVLVVAKKVVKMYNWKLKLLKVFVTDISVFSCS